MACVRYCFQDSPYRKILCSPLKQSGFVPEKESEIFVTAIPSNADVYDLALFFEQVGELFQVKLLTEAGSIHNRGFAFVTYMNATLAQKAMDMLSKKTFVGAQRLLLQKSVNNCRIFVGGVPTEKSKNEIWQQLTSIYRITNIVDVILYRNYGNPAHNRGFVFLEFRTHEEASHFRAKYAGKLNLFGNRLLVDWSVPVMDAGGNDKDLNKVKLLVKPDGSTNRGTAFVTYVNATLARKAMDELKSRPFFGNKCLNLQESANNCRIFVGGLPMAKTKDEIWRELTFTYKITNIVDVITYRNYSNPAYNRGFIFLEFRTHEEASHFRAKYANKLNLFGKRVLVDWSVPILETDENVMNQVKIIFLRNLDVTQPSAEFARHIYSMIDRPFVDKVYKFKNYAYVHLKSRHDAEKLLSILQHFYRDTEVEVKWSKPPNKFTTREFRETALKTRMGPNCVRGTAPCMPMSTISRPPSLPSDPTTRANLNPIHLAPGSGPRRLFPQSVLVESRNYCPNPNFSVNDLSLSQPSTSRNVGPWHQEIQSFNSWSSNLFRHNFSTCDMSVFGSTISSPTETAANSEIGLQDLEAVVNSLLSDS